jgi:type II secretory pathway pseudopilin PulG
MRKPTLVELFIALGILAILVSVPVHVGPGLLTGAEREAAAAELSSIQAAVDAMMVDQGLSLLPNPITVPTSNMGRFPDWESDVVGGYVLFAGIVKKNSNDYKYIAGNTTGTYICASDGTVEQVATGY